MSHPFVMMRDMTAIVIDLATRRRRSRSGRAPVRVGAAPARLIDLATYRRARPGRRRPQRGDVEHLEDRADDEDDEDDEEDWAQRAHRVLDTAAELLAAGRAAEVAEFCTLAAGCLGRNAAEIGQPRVVLDLTERLGALRAEARSACGDG
jgi:hypothetical protein